eukprot:CAMPEP_0202864026 /NCGR_PEP_ID=MMETSP1391-20130828/4437_1 /ASSEMBLY_ACC=CAM_ASM_000867 /TAXON_ID=1034604 /ORGANISM="Chlamydomonas leiostraca, Strain SAG 11-49" /LENGTH=70 /DNA_ID=CAMNT_0049543731 /DNA_START=25 /DNA_END=237 /DNA_ORIENTATION=+
MKLTLGRPSYRCGLARPYTHMRTSMLSSSELASGSAPCARSALSDDSTLLSAACIAACSAATIACSSVTL